MRRWMASKAVCASVSVGSGGSSGARCRASTSACSAPRRSRRRRQRRGVERRHRHLDRRDHRRRGAARQLLMAGRQHLGDAEQRARRGRAGQRAVLLDAAHRLAVEVAAQPAQTRLLAGVDCRGSRRSPARRSSRPRGCRRAPRRRRARLPAARRVRDRRSAPARAARSRSRARPRRGSARPSPGSRAA